MRSANSLILQIRVQTTRTIEVAASEYAATVVYRALLVLSPTALIPLCF